MPRALLPGNRRGRASPRSRKFAARRGAVHDPRIFPPRRAAPAARPAFGPRGTPRALGAKGILFPRLDAAAVKAALAPPAPAEHPA